MEGFNGAFWVGLAFAIPLSIFGNLITPFFQRQTAKYSESLGKKRELESQREADRIARYISKPQRLYTYLLTVLLASSLISSVAGIFSGVLFLAGTFTQGRIAFGAAQGVAIFGGVLVAKICVDAIKVIAKVREGGG